MTGRLLRARASADKAGRPAATGPLMSVSGLQVQLESERGLIAAVDDVALSVGAGERVGIVGESGSGKSMLARSLIGLLPPTIDARTSGRIEFDDHDLIGIAPEHLRRLRRGNFMSMVFQDPLACLNPTMRIGRQIAEALPDGRSRTERAQSVARLLSEVGLESGREMSRRYPHQLSGGQRQRVLIAIALAGEPRLLIADEPTTALDATVQVRILATLSRIQHERGMALLLISHDLALIAQMCDRVYVMYAGQIVEHGRVPELFASPRHPYTRALLSSAVSRFDGGTLEGSVPDLANLTPGCRFAERCPSVHGKCHEAPSLFTTGADARGVRCWLNASDPQNDTPIDRGARDAH